MKNNFIIKIGILVLVSANLLALVGPHADITSSTSTLTDNGEVCVYCHTPHAANNDYNPSPLWNKPTSNTAFTMYGASTSGTAGVTIAGTTSDATPTGASMACLSCHDGVSAMNSVVNAPGAGNSDINGVLIGTNPATPATMVSVAYKSVGLSGDMTDDHPISIQYIEGRASLRPVNTPVVDIVGASFVSDMLRDGKVQCSSCHDVHGTPYNTYLRSHNTGSALCFACHDK